MKITFDDQTLDLTASGKRYTVTFGDKTAEVEVLRAENGRLDFLIGSSHFTAFVTSVGARRWVTVNGRTIVLTKSSGVKRSGPGHARSSELTAPMPGQVRVVNVNAGDSVTKGQTLIVLEAMKMEIRIQAPENGKVKSVLVKQGQTVEREQILIELTGQNE